MPKPIGVEFLDYVRFTEGSYKNYQEYLDEKEVLRKKYSQKMERIRDNEKWLKEQQDLEEKE